MPVLTKDNHRGLSLRENTSPCRPPLPPLPGLLKKPCNTGMTVMGFRLGEGSVGAAYMRPVVGRQKGRVAYMRPLHTPVRRGKDETRSRHIDLTLSSGEAAYRRARPRTGREMFVPPSFDTALTRLLRMRELSACAKVPPSRKASPTRETKESSPDKGGKTMPPARGFSRTRGLRLDDDFAHLLVRFHVLVRLHRFIERERLRDDGPERA